MFANHWYWLGADHKTKWVDQVRRRATIAYTSQIETIICFLFAVRGVPALDEFYRYLQKYTKKKKKINIFRKTVIFIGHSRECGDLINNNEKKKKTPCRSKTY